MLNQGIELSLEELEKLTLHVQRFTTEGGGRLIRVAGLVHNARKEYEEKCEKSYDSLNPEEWKKYQSKTRRRETRAKLIRKATKKYTEEYENFIADLDREFHGLASLYIKAYEGDPESLHDMLLLCPDLINLKPSDFRYPLFFKIQDHVKAVIKCAFDFKQKGHEKHSKAFFNSLDVITGRNKNKRGRPKNPVPKFLLRHCKDSIINLHWSIQEDGDWDITARQSESPRDIENIMRLREEAQQRIDKGVYGGAEKPGEIANYLVAEAFKDRGVTIRMVKNI